MKKKQDEEEEEEEEEESIFSTSPIPFFFLLWVRNPPGQFPPLGLNHFLNS